MTPAEVAAGLRRAADIVERYALDVIGVTASSAQGVSIQVYRLPPEATDRESATHKGYLHTTAMLDGVRLTECHELTAADFGVRDERGDYVRDNGDGTRWVLFTRDATGPYAHRYEGDGKDERQIDAIESEGATVADVVAAVIGGDRE